MGLRQLVVLAIFFGAAPEAFAAERQPGVFQRASCTVVRTTSPNMAHRLQKVGLEARVLPRPRLMPPGAVSRECQFGLRRAFRNEADLCFASVPVRVDCCLGGFNSYHMPS